MFVLFGGERFSTMGAFRRVLSLVDREEISRGLAAEEEFKVIAKRIGRDVSVVSRELARHGGRCGYRAGLAEQRATRSRSRPKALAVERDEKLRAHVQSWLRQGWSPGPIAGDLKRHPLTSRFLILVPLTGRDSATVTQAIIAVVGQLPETIKKSLTWDCGSELALHKDVTATGLPVYFAHPHSPWLRGSNENLNRIVREFFPKGTEITNDPVYLAAGAAEINGRPREILNWQTPTELFTKLTTSNA